MQKSWRITSALKSPLMVKIHRLPSRIFHSLGLAFVTPEGYIEFKRRTKMEGKKLSLPGALVGALVGLGAEIAIREMTGLDVIEGLLEIIGAGFGLIRIDRRIYESTVKLLKGMDIRPDDDYQRIVRRIDELTVDLPELRENFLRLMDAGVRAKSA